jgi:Dna[CI] antecedent DciA-like protein
VERPLKPIGDDVRRELKRFGPMAGMADVLRAWPAAVGEQIARSAWPARFTRDGTLVVHARDAIWAFELGQREPEIRERLGALVPGQLRFLPGPIPELGAPGAEGPGEGAAKPGPLVPSPAVLAEAEQLSARIEDGDLRKLVEKAVVASLTRADSGRGF